MAIAKGEDLGPVKIGGIFTLTNEFGRTAYHLVSLENLEMSEGKGIIFPLQFMGNVIPQPDHEGKTVGGPG